MKIFVSYFFQIKELILPQRANPIKSIMKKTKTKEKKTKVNYKSMHETVT